MLIVKGGSTIMDAEKKSTLWGKVKCFALNHSDEIKEGIFLGSIACAASGYLINSISRAKRSHRK